MRGDGDLGLGLGVCLLTRRVDERGFALVLPVAAGAVYVTVRLLSVGITHIHCVDTMSMGSIFLLQLSIPIHGPFVNVCDVWYASPLIGVLSLPW